MQKKLGDFSQGHIDLQAKPSFVQFSYHQFIPQKFIGYILSYRIPKTVLYT